MFVLRLCVLCPAEATNQAGLGARGRESSGWGGARLRTAEAFLPAAGLAAAVALTSVLCSVHTACPNRAVALWVFASIAVLQTV